MDRNFFKFTGISLLFIGVVLPTSAYAQLSFLNKLSMSEKTASDFTSSNCSNKNERDRNQLIGGALGGIAGGLLGREVAKDNKTLGTTIGAAGGALLGSQVGKKLTPCDKSLISQSKIKALETGQSQTWSNEESGNSGGWEIAATSIPEPGKKTCRDAKQTGVGVSDTNYQLCKDADGVWRPAN